VTSCEKQFAAYRDHFEIHVNDHRELIETSGGSFPLQFELLADFCVGK
jgi:hypothetical protein